MIGRIRISRLSRYAIIAVALPMAATPLAANPEVMTFKLCSADGTVRDISIPVNRDNGDKDCAQPCHACLSRKKNSKS